jgi:transcriptional regulator with XRE-family HTH domain
MNTSVKTDLGNKEIFSRNLNRYLRLSGKTQKEVAAAVDISTGTFCDWTKGRAYPRMDKVQKLAEYFGIRMSDLVENVNIGKETISNQEQEIFDLFHKVPEEKRELVLSMIRAAIDNL